MKKISKYAAVMLAVMMCLGLSACGRDFDAAAYVKSAMDASYQGEYEEYAKICNVSVEDAMQQIKESKTELIKQELAELGISDESLIESYVELESNIEKLAKYKVKEAKKQKDGNYVVAVEVEPSNVNTTLQQNVTEVAQQVVEAGEDPISDNNLMYQILEESINRSISANEYGEVQTIEVKVTKRPDELYGLEQSEMEKIENALFPQS